LKNIILAGIVLMAVRTCESSKIEEKPLTNAVHAAPVKKFPPLSEKEKKNLHAQVENILQQSLLRGRFNGAILVAKNGEIIYEKYVGVKEPRSKDSITAETPFQIASTGKTLTSAAVLKLAEEGALSLEDSVKKFFPGFAYEGSTVNMLLSPRSGVPKYL
jgi:CubicO group peptidase (beta-lactamase class C family)